MSFGFVSFLELDTRNYNDNTRVNSVLRDIHTYTNANVVPGDSGQYVTEDINMDIIIISSSSHHTSLTKT